MGDWEEIFGAGYTLEEFESEYLSLGAKGSQGLMDDPWMDQGSNFGRAEDFEPLNYETLREFRF